MRWGVGTVLGLLTCIVMVDGGFTLLPSCWFELLICELRMQSICVCILIVWYYASCLQDSKRSEAGLTKI